MGLALTAARTHGAALGGGVAQLRRCLGHPSRPSQRGMTTLDRGVSNDTVRWAGGDAFSPFASASSESPDASSRLIWHWLLKYTTGVHVPLLVHVSGLLPHPAVVANAIMLYLTPHSWGH